MTTAEPTPDVEGNIFFPSNEPVLSIIKPKDYVTAATPKANIEGEVIETKYIPQTQTFSMYKSDEYRIILSTDSTTHTLIQNVVTDHIFLEADSRTILITSLEITRQK